MSNSPFDPTQIGQATALVTLVGFAIQQALQALDTFVATGIAAWKAKRPEGTLPGNLSDADFKKSIMVKLSFLLGLSTVLAVPKLQLLQYIGITEASDGAAVFLLDVLVSALIFGAGTEGANTALKYFGYVKDARKKTIIELDLVLANINTNT